MGASQFRRGSITDKILSVFFAVVLIISLAPSASYAQDEEVSAVSTEQEEVSAEDAVVNDSSEQGNNESLQSEDIISNDNREGQDTSSSDIPKQQSAETGVQSNGSNSENPSHAGLTEKSQSQTESYVGMDMTFEQTWMVGVTVTSPSGGLPSADDGAYVSCEPVDANELTSAISSAYDGQSGYTTALRLKIVGSDGSETTLPEGCSVTVRLIDGNNGVSPQAFTLKDGVLSGLESYDFTGDTSMAEPGHMFDVAVDGDASLLNQTFAWVDMTGLTEKSEETTLSPGTYSVCANLFVKGEDNLILEGVNAYLTGSSIPPTMPCQTNNATLLVGEDKSLTLKLNLDTIPAEVFTLQDIQSSEDVEVLSSVRGVGPNYDKYVSTGDPSVYRSDRIKSLTLKLNNTKGEYSFGSCTEFPTLIGKDMNMPLTLTVDFSSAKKGFDPGDGKTLFEKTFTDSVTGVSAHVRTTEVSLGEKLEKADFSISSNNEDSFAIEKALANQFASVPNYWAYKAVFTCDGESVELAGNTFIEWTVPWSDDAVSVYSWNGSVLTDIESNLSNGICAFADEASCSFVMLNSNNAYKWLSKTSVDNGTQVLSTLSISTVHEFAEGWLGFAELHASKAEIDGGTRYNVVWKNTGSEGKFNFIPSSEKVTFTIPADENQTVYLVQDNGTSKTAKRVAVGTSAGTSTFDFFESTDSESEIDCLCEAMLRAYDGNAPTQDAPIAYFMVRQGNDSIESDYIVAKALSYTGQPQQGFELSQNVEVVEGDDVSQTNAGNYKTKIQPKDGFTWFDGTRDIREIDWSISKVQLQMSYRIGLPWNAGVGSLPEVDEVKQSLSASMTGFVNGETPDTISDFELSVTKGSKIEEAIKDGSLQPATSYGYVINVSSQNYEVSNTLQYTAAVVVVGVELQDEPVLQEGLTYTGLDQTGLSYNSKFDFTDDSGEWIASLTGKDAGTYSCVVTPKYAWSDGSIESRDISFEIAPAELTATYEGETITAGSKPSGAVSVKGFVNGETELTAKDYVAPTVKYPSNLTEGEYTLTPEGGSAANYVFKNVSGVLKVNKASDVEQLKPGTYTVTSNLYLPGELNTQLPGVTAYLTNPNNPLGQKPDGYTGPFESTAPTTPASDNAQLVVGEDGSLTLTLQVLNPVFTLQNIENCQNAEVLKVKRDSKTYSDVTGSASRQGRITEITVKLNDNSGSYVFNTCTEFPTLLGVDWNVPLTLDVDFSAVPGYTPAPPSDTVNYAKLNAAIVNAQNAIKNARVSADGSDVDALDTWVTQGAVDILSKAIEAAKQALTSNSQDEVDFAATTLNAATMALNQSAKNGTKVSNGGTSGGNNGGNNSGNNASDAGQVAVTESGHYAQGTYTVSGNVWFDKSVTGLPLNPHISNGAFPPKDPVSGNATMTVDGSGHAWVSIPVVIQDKVMVVNNVWGSGVSYNGSNVVIDLGTPRAGQTSFNGTCTANITMGALASTISGKSGSYTWSANWAVSFGSASMASGGGTIPAAALAALAGVEGTVDEASAEEAALAALDSDSAKSASGKTKNGSASSEDPNSILPLVAGIAAAVIVCGGAIAAAVAIRRKRSGSQKE